MQRKTLINVFTFSYVLLGYLHSIAIVISPVVCVVLCRVRKPQVES
jgi:hypothetical protein